MVRLDCTSRHGHGKSERLTLRRFRRGGLDGLIFDVPR
jgi:hypothetical protein